MVKKEITLQELHDTIEELPDYVEVWQGSDWYELWRIAPYEIINGQIVHYEHNIAYVLGQGEDKWDYTDDANKLVVIRYEIDEHDIDNPHVPEDDFVEQESEGIVDRIKSGYWELRVDYEPYVDSSVVAFTLFLHSRIGTIEIDTFCDYSEITDLYDLSSRSWNMSAVNEYWNGLSECRG